MSWFSRCSWCGGPFNDGNCRRCTNVSFGDEFVSNPDPILNDETPVFSYPPSQPQTSLLDQWHCFHCKDPLEEGERCKRCTCKWCGSGLSKGSCFICSSVEALVSIPSESEDTSGIDSEYILPSCDNLSPINVYEEKSVTFSNPLFDSNDDFTSSDDESLSDEDVPEDNVKIYSNPLFEFDDEYISSDVNPVFDEVLEDIECNDSYDSNLDESNFLVTPLFDSNEDEFFAPGDDIELLLHRDSSTPMISVVSILKGFTNELPLKENDDLFDLEPKKNEWKKISYNDPIDDLIFDPGGDIDEIDAFLDVDISTNIENGYHDSEGDIIYLESFLNNDTIPYLPPEVFLDHDPNNLKDGPDLKSIVKVFNPGIHGKNFSPTYVSLPFKDRHYLSFTYVIQIFLPYFTYPVDSFLPLSSGSEDIIFDLGISTFHFSSLKPVAYKCPMEVCSSICFVPIITMI
ncbi:hypothetical protein Tco_1170164 [Tanacetum coccineum]